MSASAEAWRRRESLRCALAGTLLMMLSMGIGRFAYTPLLPGLREALGWSLAGAGDVASANYFGYVAGALVAATIASRRSQRHGLVAAAIASALTTGAGVAVFGEHGWLALRAASGFASAFTMVLGTAIIIARLVALGRPGLVALYFAGVGLGIVASVGVIEVSRATGFSVFGQWAALGIASVVLAACALRLLFGGGRTEPDWAAESGAAPAAVPLSTVAPEPANKPADARTDARTLGRLIAAYGLFGFGYVVTATFLVEIARGVPGSAYAEPVTWIAVGIGAIPSTWFWQRVAARAGLWTTLRIAYVVEAVGVLLAGYGSGIAALVAGGVLLGGTFVGITALGLATARSVAARRIDRVVGWMTAAFGIGQWIGPAIAGRLAEASGGFGLPSLAAAALLVVGAAMLGPPAQGR